MHAQLCLTFCNPMHCSPPGFSVHGIPRQEHWCGFLFPSPENLPDPEIELGSPAWQADSLPSEPPGKLHSSIYMSKTTLRMGENNANKATDEGSVSKIDKCSCISILKKKLIKNDQKI